MKKTLILMFAAACSAMAADYTEVTETGTALDMQNFGSDNLFIPSSNKYADTKANFTLVFNVDFSGLLNNNTADKNLFTITGKTDRNANYTMGVILRDTDEDLTKANICFTSNSNTNNFTFPTNAAYYSIVVSCYEYNAQYTYFIPTLYAYNEQGELLNNGTFGASYWRMTTRSTKTNITLDFNTDLIDSIRVYNSVLEKTDAKNAAKAVLGFTPGDGNVPEPTTATLSLMALAGLAARRRRK